MSGLLQRLAGQALGAQAQRTPPQIRSAMSVHAQVPVGPARDGNEPQSAPSLIVDTPGSEPPVLQTLNHALPAVDSSASLARAPASQLVRVPEATLRSARLIEPRAATRVAPSIDSPRERPPSDDAARYPPPLLDEVPVATAPPAIAPVTTASAISVTNTSGDTSPEPTEVHVHIGRIEVIAMPELAAPKKPRVAMRNALSLSDYLAKRRRS